MIAPSGSDFGSDWTDKMATESHIRGNDDTKAADNGSSGGTAAGGWFGALKSRLGLPGSQTLRDTIEAALSADEAGPETFSAQERAMLLRLLRYGALRIEDVMVPRADIIAIDENDTVGRALQLFVDAGVSRLPLYRDTLDDPTGMVHVKDLIQWLVTIDQGLAKSVKSEGLPNGNVGLPQDTPEDAGEDRLPPKELAACIRLKASDDVVPKPLSAAKLRRPVLFVPPSMPAMNLLIRMQTTRIHMAVVVDEYGGTDGLVTIEDLVEEIVGEIEDEHDELEAEHITVDAKSEMVASARTPIDDLEQRLAVKLLDDDETDIDTLGGLVFSLVGRVPARGELVPHPSGVEFEVLDADPRRIKKLKIHVAKREEAMEHATVGQREE